MADWTPPLELPRFEDEEMKQLRSEYVAKEGYHVVLPSLRDIVHISAPRQPSGDEFELWRFDNIRELGVARYGEITDYMNNSSRRYHAALASPTPSYGKNIASVMTFFDDWNDWLGTAAVAMRITAHFAPRVLAKFFLGPAGWLLLAADIAGLMMNLLRLASPSAILQACIARKRFFEGVTRVNPFSRNSRAARANKLKKFLPSKGELIEAAQVTDQIWGIGLCLGPVMGFAQDAISGAYRAYKGEDVTWFTKPPPMREYERKGLLHVRHAQMMAQIGPLLSDEDHFWTYVSLNMAMQLCRPYLEMWNPLDQCEGLQYVELKAPSPTSPATIWLLKQNGISPGEAEGWTGLDKQYATYEELWDYNQPRAAKRLMEYAVRNRQNIVGAIGCQNATEFGQTVMYLASD